MLFSRRNQTRSAWRLTIPERYGLDPYIIKTSPVVLGSSLQCDIIIKDSSLCESHIQFVLIKDGKYLEIYDLVSGITDVDKSTERGVAETERAIEARKIEAKKIEARREERFGYKNRTLLNGEVINGKKKLTANKDKVFTLKVGDVNLALTYSDITDQITKKNKYMVKEREIEWFYLHEGVEYGPVRRSEMSVAVREALLLPLDDVWHSGLKHRIKAFEIPDLFAEKTYLPDLVSRTPDLEKHICPYCWHGFKSDELLYIARHPTLMGDPVLGYDEQQRFVPRYIKPLRRAVDSRGEICSDMACPRCHLRIPTPFLDSLPLFFSIIGTPGSGKSYYLASSTWRLRTILPKYFGLNFEDIDNITNQWINSYEEKLFLPARGVDYNAIEKTQIESGRTAKQVKINAVNMFLPLPAIFSLLSNNNYYHSERIQHTLAFYDNAGEHFQSGQDVIQKPGSLHMLRANGFLFLFDPTADPRFNNVINVSLRGKIVQTVYQQQKILIETIDRLRKHTGLNIKDKFYKPIVIGISKADILMDYFEKEGVNLRNLPYKVLKKNEVNQMGVRKMRASQIVANEIGVLDISHINQVSAAIRELFCRFTPEFVNTIESFAENVIYLPLSAIGHQPDSKGVHPGDIRPLWVEVPFLYILSKMGYIPNC